MGKKYTPPPESLANLKPAKPGEVRNALGINRKKPITDRYYERAEDALPDKIRRQFNEKLGIEALKEGATWADANALRRFMDTLMEGGERSAKEIREAIEGKAPQRIELSGPERKEITISVKFDMENP